MRKGWAFLGGVLLAACGGKGTSSSASCGAGTTQQGGGCVAILTCGPGTTIVDNVCELDGLVPKACGAGTELVNGICEPADESQPVSCGAGTVAQGNECVPSADAENQGGTAGEAPALVCGPGTYASRGLCLPTATETGEGGASSAPSCGPGTHEVDGQCVTSAEHFELRLPETNIQADGISKVPVLAFGTDANGQPITDSMIVFVSRVDAGQVNPATIALTDFGTQTSFVPCNAAATPTCVGAFELRMVRANDSSVVLAKVAATLVTPDGVGSTAQCKIGGNVLYLNGASGDFIHPGEVTITDGTFSADLVSGLTNLHVHLDPGNTNVEGLWWDVYFDTSKVGVPLAPGVFKNAERWPFEGGEDPGLDVSGDGRGCNMLEGSFQIESLTVTSGVVSELTASFQQFCDGGAALNGCVHYTAP